MGVRDGEEFWKKFFGALELLLCVIHEDLWWFGDEHFCFVFDVCADETFFPEIFEDVVTVHAWDFCFSGDGAGERSAEFENGDVDFYFLWIEAECLEFVVENDCVVKKFLQLF